MSGDPDLNTILAETRTTLAHERTNLAVDRNRLANERTYLAWLRTGLASVGGGIAVIRLLTFHSAEFKMTAQFIGGLLVFIGIGMFILSSVDYLKCYRLYENKQAINCSTRITAAIGFIFAFISIVLIYMTAQPGH